MLLTAPIRSIDRFKGEKMNAWYNVKEIDPRDPDRYNLDDIYESYRTI
jgi:hypothetical protein